MSIRSKELGINNNPRNNQAEPPTFTSPEALSRQQLRAETRRIAASINREMNKLTPEQLASMQIKGGR